MDRVKTIQLGSVANYSDDRVSFTKLSPDNYIGTDNLLQNKLGKTKALYTPKIGLTAGYEEGDILIGNIRPYLKKIWYATNNGGSSADVLTIKVKKDNDSKFVYYSLFRDDFFAHMMKGSKGTKMPRGDKTQVLDFLIPDFPITIQQKIASVLSLLDSQIELNNRINIELEATVRTLYNYWFVQFDFPDKNNKPYKTGGGKMTWNEELKKEIPENWEVKKISDLLPVLTGKEDANFATHNGIYPFFTCAENISLCDEFSFEGKSILLAGNGNFNIKLYEGKFNAYQRTYVLIPYNDEHYTIVYLAVKDRIKSLTNSSRGSIVKFITKGDIENITIVLPKLGSSKLFNKLNTITKKIELNSKENQKLSELRDWLLPMLMNGQIKIK